MPEPDLNHPELAVQEIVGREVRLGRQRVSPKPMVQLAKYVDLEQVLPSLRRSVGHALGLSDFHMCANDRLGDCTTAAVEHGTHILQWQDKHGADNAESDQRAIDLYWKTGSQDDGRVCTNVLGYVRRNGYGGRKDAIIGYAGVDISNIGLVSAGIDLLGGTYIGVNLPVTAQRQRIWKTVDSPDTNPDSEPGSWGGHCVWIPGYNHLSAGNSHWIGEEPVITWGMRLYMTQDFWTNYVEEAYVIVSGEWLNSLGKSPRGFDVAQLESDLKSIAA